MLRAPRLSLFFSNFVHVSKKYSHVGNDSHSGQKPAPRGVLATFMTRHPIVCNLLIILVVAVLGILIVYFSLAIFTKHGRSRRVPGVENMSYTQAISRLHDNGFKIEIRDSLYRDDIRPGYVIEQFPKANSIVKPGRKIFLYINAVHPKEVIVDDDNAPGVDAFRGVSFRSGMAKLEELGFKNVRVVRVLGENETIVRLLANGRAIKKMQKVAVNVPIVVEVADGRLAAMRDSLQNLEMYEQHMLDGGYETADYASEESNASAGQEPSQEEEYYEPESEFLQ